MKVSSYKFASMLGISRRSLFNKENGITPWTFNELIAIDGIMKANGVEEQLTVSCDGKLYLFDVKNIA